MSERTKQIWLARDDDGELYAFPTKPKLLNEIGIWDDDSGESIDLGWDEVFSEITFENSPVKANVEAYHDALEEKDITLVK